MWGAYIPKQCLQSCFGFILSVLFYLMPPCFSLSFACVHMYVHGCAHVCRCVETGGWYQDAFLNYFFTWLVGWLVGWDSLSLILELTDWLGWISSKVPRAIYLCPLAPGVTDLCHLIWLLHGCWGSTLRLSCLLAQETFCTLCQLCRL